VHVTDASDSLHVVAVSVVQSDTLEVEGASRETKTQAFFSSMYWLKAAPTDKDVPTDWDSRSFTWNSAKSSLSSTTASAVTSFLSSLWVRSMDDDSFVGIDGVAVGLDVELSLDDSSPSRVAKRICLIKDSFRTQIGAVVGGNSGDEELVTFISMYF